MTDEQKIADLLDGEWHDAKPHHTGLSWPLVEHMQLLSMPPIDRIRLLDASKRHDIPSEDLSDQVLRGLSGDSEGSTSPVNHAMADEQHKPVRRREEQKHELAVWLRGDRSEYGYGAESDAEHHILEAEARGAEEQRRKDAEGQEPRTCNHCGGTGEEPGAYYLDGSPYSCSVCDGSGVIYLRPANAAALEARIAELERENTTLKKRVINAAETLLSIETPCMEGDNFAVTICSYFEDCEGEPCDNGWHEGATKVYEEIKDAVLQHFRAALTREGGV